MALQLVPQSYNSNDWQAAAAAQKARADLLEAENARLMAHNTDLYNTFRDPYLYQQRYAVTRDVDSTLPIWPFLGAALGAGLGSALAPQPVVLPVRAYSPYRYGRARSRGRRW